MAELYAKPFETIETGYNPQQPQDGGQQGEMEAYLASLPPEERQAAIERINAPLSGEELAIMASSGQRKPTLEEFAEIEKWHKSHEISFFDGLGKIAEGGEQVMEDLSKAFGAALSDPADVASKMPATAVEAFAQGTRNFYGMLAQSQNPDSTLFRIKDFLNGTGTIEDRYNQYLEAIKFNRHSADLMEGKTTIVMDKDMINHEVTQGMAYIADPTLFIPFGKVASTGLRAVGLGEKLTLAGAKAIAIKNGIIGNTIKWGAGQPLEFLGGAVRNTIDYGLEKAGAAFEATTGIEAKQFAQTARMSGIGFSASSVAGHAVPYASTISDAYIVGSSAKGFGEALTLVGETMSKNKFGRGINSWAAEALEQAKKNGVALSPHAEGLLKTLNAVDPLFAYGWNGLEGAAEGALIGGGLGYLSGGEEGMYSGIGAGIALGGVGATAGKVVADVTGGTAVARRAVQAKMVIEGHKVNKPKKAMVFQAMQTAAEARGQDVDLVNGIISGIDNVAPDFEFHALTPDEFKIEAEKAGYNPDTGRFVEMSALNAEFGDDRASKSRAMYILRSIGGDFVGDSKAFLAALKKASAKDSANPSKPASNIPLQFRKYTDVAKTFDKLTKTQQDAILKEIDAQVERAGEVGGKTKLREAYDAYGWAESWTDSLVKKFETDREGARKDITDMIAQETKKDGKLTWKGMALVDKLRTEGFLDKEGKLLRQRNLLQADMTLMKFSAIKGSVMRREADGKTHMYINLENMGSETFPHELFHTIMRESPMKDHFTKSLIQKLVGSFDDQGNLVRNGEVNIDQLRKFFKKYIDLTSFNEDGTLNTKKANDTMDSVEKALAEYEQFGVNKKISDEARGLVENLTEEFGAYYFSHWLMGRNRNTLFFGGELKGIEGLVERTKDSFMDFWQSKVSKSNPEFDFSRGLNASFDRSKGLGRISSMDYFMRDMVRAASNANREMFRPDSMTLENLRDFERSNGLRNLTTQEGNRRLNPREQVTQNIRLGKEAYKIISGLDKNLRTSKDTIDENGKPIITGRLSEAELDALVKGGIVPRAWADKVNQGYAMLDGIVSNVFSAGYLGKTEQTTDASYPRKTGKDVAFKNRRAVLFDVETKINAEGTFYTLFHTLDLAVIEQRGNHLWQNTDYRNLWSGDKGAMEADFFKYISNASKASTDTSKLDSAVLLEKGDGLGAARRDVLQQMAGMALQTGDAYKHQPIAVIPEGIRHSVTSFNIDGLTTPRVEQGSRYDINMRNAHKFIRENWQPDEMRQEKTPVGRVLTHESGFKFTQDSSGRIKAYDNSGIPIGTFGSIREATSYAKRTYDKALVNLQKTAENLRKENDKKSTNYQPLDRSVYEEAEILGDIFATERLKQIVGNSKLVRQTFDEFLGQALEEIKSSTDPKEYNELLNRFFNDEFKELIELEKELKKDFDPLLLEQSQLAEQEKELTSNIVKMSQEKARLKDNPADQAMLDMYSRMYQRKLEVNKRVSEIIQRQYDLGITDYSSSYYISKRFLEQYESTGKLSDEALKFILRPRLMKEYEANFKTGQPVTFLANHGTPNHELIASKTFNMSMLGKNTGSVSAFNATFFAGSIDTSMTYVGNPIPMSWVKDFIDARTFYVKKLPKDIRVKLETLIQSDTSRGVKQKADYVYDNLHEVFPEHFKLTDTSRKTPEGEPILSPSPTTMEGEHIYNLVDKILEGAGDEDTAFGGREMYWKESGRNPYLLRNIVKMDNPLVHEYSKADFRDETFASVIKRAKESGHDGVIFKNTIDGGSIDTIYASFAKNEDGKIFTLETSEDNKFAKRGKDESGREVKGGSELQGRNYQPMDYEGGDDYYKPKKNIFERKDEQGFLIRRPYVGNDEITGNKEARGHQPNPDSISWEDIGHYSGDVQYETGMSHMEAIRWENKNNGLWYFKRDTGIKLKNPMLHTDNPNFTHGDWFDNMKNEDVPQIWGRYEKPIYDKKGNLTRRGRISITSQYRGQISGWSDAKSIKESLVKSLKAGSPDDYDAYMFDASDKMKNDRGYSSKDTLPIKFQPNEPSQEAHKPRYEIDQLLVDKLKNTFKKDEQLSAYELLKFIVDNNGFMSPLAKVMMESLDSKGLSALVMQQGTSGKKGQKGAAGWTRANYEPFSNKVHMVLERVENRKKTIFASYEECAIEEVLHAITFSKVPEAIKHGTTIEAVSKNIDYLLANEKNFSETFEGNENRHLGTDKGWFTLARAWKEVKKSYDTGLRPDGIAMTRADKHVIEYRLSNMAEFIVGVTQDKEMQAILSKIKVPKSEVSLLQRVFNAIKKIWNVSDDAMDSLLAQTSDAAERILTRDRQRSEVQDGGIFAENSKYYTLGSPKFQPNEPTQGGRTYTPEQMSGRFIGRVASENPKLIKYKKIVFTKDTEKGKLGEDTYRLTIKPKDEVASEVKVGYINVEVNGTDATVEYVKVNPRWEGEGYGKLLYSEMVERLRSLGVKEFSGMIIDESGRPQKIRKKIIDQENTRIGEPDDTLIGRTRRDRYGDTQTDVTSYLKEKAWYQPADYQGGDDYYKPKKNQFESKDEQGFLIRKYYRDIDKGDLGQNPEAISWMEIGHSRNDKNAGIWYLDRDNASVKKNKVSKYATHEEWFDDMDEKHPIRGRIEFAGTQDVFGKINERTKISIAGKSVYDFFNDKDFKPDLTAEKLFEIKKKVAKAYGLDPETVDAYYFGADKNIKNAFGFSEKDQLPIKFQPDEPSQQGRKYNKPNDYQGGDNYWKQQENIFESKDDQGFLIRKAKAWDKDNKPQWNKEAVSWTDIGHFFGWGSEKGMTDRMKNWVIKNSGLYEMGIETNEFSKLQPYVEKERTAKLLKPTGGDDLRDITHALWFDGEVYKKSKDYSSRIYGRYELPKYNADGTLERRGRISINQNSVSSFSELVDAKKRIVENLGLKEDDVDAYFFGQNKEIKNSQGLSEKDELHIKFQPSEFTDFTTEKTASGRILKNAKGYAIILANNKFRVYNPNKAIIGVYNSEEEAKKRIYREIPKR